MFKQQPVHPTSGREQSFRGRGNWTHRRLWSIREVASLVSSPLLTGRVVSSLAELECSIVAKAYASNLQAVPFLHWNVDPKKNQNYDKCVTRSLQH